MERFEEAKRWLMQALRDLSAAVESFRDGYFEWSCFQAQQAAEKLLKLFSMHMEEARGHTIVELLDYLKDVEGVSEELYTYARELDRHYIPSRYPNAFESGYPALYYDSAVAERALNSANKIIEWVKQRLKALGLSV